MNRFQVEIQGKYTKLAKVLLWLDSWTDWPKWRNLTDSQSLDTNTLFLHWGVYPSPFMNDYLSLPLNTDFTTELKCAPFLDIFLCWRPQAHPNLFSKVSTPSLQRTCCQIIFSIEVRVKNVPLQIFRAGLIFLSWVTIDLTTIVKTVVGLGKRHPNCPQAHSSERDRNRGTSL